MITVGMKAAVDAPDQLNHRMRCLAAQDLPTVIELHTSRAWGLSNVSQRNADAGRLRDLRTRWNARFILHGPPQEMRHVCEVDYDRSQIEATVSFARDAGADSIVLHRYFGLKRPGAKMVRSKAAAEEGFLEELLWISRVCESVTAFIENLGFFWFLPREACNYLSSPLDHFFPWEIDRFGKFVTAHELTNIRPAIDLAHAAQSSNMFNLRRSDSNAYGADPRFRGITAEDLDNSEWLEPADFIRPNVHYVHASDASVISRVELNHSQPLAADRIWMLMTNEGQALGTFDLDVRTALQRLGAADAVTVIAEVDPGAGETHCNNAAQERSVRLLVESAGRTGIVVNRRKQNASSSFRGMGGA